jgi:hypothetical protein
LIQFLKPLPLGAIFFSKGKLGLSEGEDYLLDHHIGGRRMEKKVDPRAQVKPGAQDKT